MKIKFLIAAIACVFLVFGTQKASAQLHFGVKAGVDVADHSLNTSILNAHNRVGFQLGGAMELMTPLLGLGVEADLLYGHKDYSASSDVENSDPKIKARNYLTLPVYLKEKFSIFSILGAFVQAGGYITENFGNAGDLRYLVQNYKAKNFEAGVGAGAGITLVKHVDLGIYYRCALTDSYANQKVDLGNLLNKKRQTWTVGLTYFF